MMEFSVLTWLVLHLTDSPAAVALVGVFRAIPMFLLGLVAGSLADRFPKRRIMISGQITNLAVFIAVTVLLTFGVVRQWHVYAAIFASGSVWALDYSARRSYYADVLERS